MWDFRLVEIIGKFNWAEILVFTIFLAISKHENVDIYLDISILGNK